ncbi:phosphatases II [Ramicandelaber brevisporus]|nr:phosphatases II [Ramicandelaber brevisporus]
MGRHEDDEFSLNLSYITPRLIATSFPAQGIESLWRNPRSALLAFLHKHHIGHGQLCKVYNLCAERPYEPRISTTASTSSSMSASLSATSGAVTSPRLSTSSTTNNGNHSNMMSSLLHYAHYGFADHCPAPIELMLRFCEDAARWLLIEPNKDSVAVVHCKAGKGRTGLMICALLLYMQHYETVDDVMRFYSSKRMKLNKETGEPVGDAITIPSQKRYLKYFHRAVSTRQTQLQQQQSAPTQTQTQNEIAETSAVIATSGGIIESGSSLISPILSEIGNAVGLRRPIVRFTVTVSTTSGDKPDWARYLQDTIRRWHIRVYVANDGTSATSLRKAGKASFTDAKLSSPVYNETEKKSTWSMSLELANCAKQIFIHGDVRIEVLSIPLFAALPKAPIFHFWFNTDYEPSNKLALGKHELDGIDTSEDVHPVIDAGFQFKIEFG